MNVPMMDLEQDSMSLKLMTRPIVTTQHHGLVIQTGGMRHKSYALTTRYAASGIVTKFEFDTRVLEYVEVDDEA